MPKVEACRICGSDSLFKFLDLGPTPLANSFVKPGDAGKDEPRYPLDVCLCRECGLVQLGYVVPPEIMFKDYIYFSSTSDTLRAHFAELAREALERHLSEGDLVVEIASNDGVLLKNLLGKGVRVLGVEPATNVARVAIESGVDTLNDFFNSETAKSIRESKGPAKLILANNVFAHIPDLHGCVQGFSTLLSDDGAVIIEFPYLGELCRNTEFDTIYHEHLSYFSLKPIMRLFESHGMEVFDASFQAVHGGTIRVYIQKKNGGHKVDAAKISGILASEAKAGLYDPAFYASFAQAVNRLRSELVSLLERLKAEGKSVAIYGAPAKGNTLLNFCKINTGLVSFAVDKSGYKQGLLTPGTHIPIFGTSLIMERRPDYLLILAWNFSDEIIAQQSEYRKSGGKFIIPVPKPRIV